MNDRKPFIAVNASPAMSGHFATLYVWTHLEDDIWFTEPEDTGFGRYATWQEANIEGAEWAERSGYEFVPCTQEKVDRAKRWNETRDARVARVVQLRKESNLSLREAIAIADKEFGV